MKTYKRTKHFLCTLLTWVSENGSFGTEFSTSWTSSVKWLWHCDAYRCWGWGKGGNVGQHIPECDGHQELRRGPPQRCATSASREWSMARSQDSNCSQRVWPPQRHSPTSFNKLENTRMKSRQTGAHKVPSSRERQRNENKINPSV